MSKIKWEERPTMKQIYMKLEGLRKSKDYLEISEVESIEGSSSISIDVGDDELVDDNTILSFKKRTP